MNASAVGKVFEEVDRAYLAGLIDGDGCIMATIERHSEKKFGFRVRLSIKITQKENSLLLFLARKYSVGKVRVNRKNTIFETFDWIVYDTNALRMIIDLIIPYSKTKNKQLKIAREILEVSDATFKGLTKKARLADALSLFNVRSKNRRKNFMTMIKANISSND
jgi:LAGLIDADG endonuclease